MPKEKITRKALLKSPDEFMTFSNRAAIFVREHSKQFSYVGYGIAAVLVLYLGVSTYLDYGDRKGQEAYNKVFYSLMRDTRPETGQKDIQKWETLLNEVIDEHGMAKVSRLAYPELAYLKFVQKKYDEAIPLYQEFMNKVPESSPYRSLSRLGIAACHEEKGEFQKAIAALNLVLSSQDDPFRPLAMLGLARAYGLANQPEKAKEILTEFVEKSKDSPFLPMAKAHLNKFNS